MKRRKIYHLWFKSFLRQGLNFLLHHQDNHQQRKIEGSIALPQPLADEVQRHAEEQDKLLTTLDEADQPTQEEQTQTLEDENTFPSLWGGGTFFRSLISRSNISLPVLISRSNISRRIVLITFPKKLKTKNIRVVSQMTLTQQLTQNMMMDHQKL